jgi:hypothetical protein
MSPKTPKATRDNLTLLLRKGGSTQKNASVEPDSLEEEQLHSWHSLLETPSKGSNAAYGRGHHHRKTASAHLVHKKEQLPTLEALQWLKQFESASIAFCSGKQLWYHADEFLGAGAVSLTAAASGRLRLLR